VTTLVVVFALVAAGCTDDRDTTSTAPEFTNGSGCDYGAVLSNAKALFGHYSAGYQLAVQLSEQTPKSAAATNLGFDILAAIAGLRDASGLTDAQTTKAARLTVQVIRCAQVKATGVKTAAAFNKALGATGAFQVRGGTSTAGVPDPSTSVLALDKQAGVQAPADDFAAAEKLAAGLLKPGVDDLEGDGHWIENWLVCQIIRREARIAFGEPPLDPDPPARPAGGSR
jgi:hypothetical protein